MSLLSFNTDRYKTLSWEQILLSSKCLLSALFAQCCFHDELIFIKN